VLVDHLHLPDHRHEVRIAVPTRNDVKVDVVRDAGAGHPADIGADVEALGLERSRST
jgi:hypothetical protein